MSYSWRLSSGTTSKSKEEQPSSNSSSSTSNLGSAAVETPLTPPTVRNVSPSTCLAIGQFRALMQEYRSLDDGVTTRLNRALASSRATGQTSSPSLLSINHHPSSSTTAPDLGKSTYGTAPETACAAFWKELVNVWVGREEVLAYCIAISERGTGGNGSVGGVRGDASRLGEERLLDADLARDERVRQLQTAGPGAPFRSAKPVKTDDFDARSSRSEGSDEVSRRHMKNELAIEAIIRKRSLDVFKSRCRFFEPTFSEGARGEKEKAMWEGKDTRAARQASAEL